MRTNFNLAKLNRTYVLSCFSMIMIKRYVPLILTLLLLYFEPVSGQIGLCNHDEATEALINTNPGILQQLQIDEAIILENMQSNPQAIMNGETYIIPIVFHILHLGEPEGSGSNISRAQVLQALDDLNSAFAHTKIQWCLAQQDPDGNSQYDGSGNNITGIRRVNASGIPNFITYGIWPDVNEVDAKALSNWPEADYTEVWVAHRLYTGSGDAAGFAYFPAAGDDIDGIALRADATGIFANSQVFAHEAGHYLTLYHTFQESTELVCPPNADCAAQGDMICDTRAHKKFSYFPYPCDESQYLACDPGFSHPYLITENHMNYTDNSCRVEFTPKQDMRMRSALMSLRGSLLSSVGCMEGCTDVIADFTFPMSTIGIGATMNFTNTSTGATSYTWSLDGNEQSTTTNWIYQFNMGGNFTVCLDAFGADGCVNRVCKQIHVTPSCIPTIDLCEKVQNGDFEQIGQGNLDVNNFKNVCGWEKIQSSPYFCDGLMNNAIGLYFYKDEDIERVTTSQSLELEVSKNCKVSFDYLVTKSSPNQIIVALAENNNQISYWGTPLESSAKIIASISNPAVDYNNQLNNKCYNDNFSFHHYDATFMITDPLDQYLTLTGIGGSGESIVFIDNVSVSCCDISSCEPNPDFTFDPDCPREFNGTNTGDEGEYTWNFLCNGISMTGQNVTIDLPAGTCEVCLTIACDEETARTVCKTVIIPERSEECLPACQPLTLQLQACEQDTSQSNTFVANFSLVVPKGTVPCNGNGGISGSQMIDIKLVSISINDNSPVNDVIEMGLEVTTPPGFDLLSNPVAGVINLCDTLGNVICYTLTFEGTVCDNCGGEISVVAVCDDPDPLDDTFEYSGSVIINLPDIGFPCGGTSTQVGYSQMVTMNGSIATIDFTITTNQVGEIKTKTLLCFLVSGERICYMLNIDVRPCVEDDFECIQKWDTKNVNCTSAGDGTLTYNFSMGPGMIYSSIYRICSGGLRTILLDGNGDPISGGSVLVNSGALFSSSFVFNIDITVPCAYEGEIIILKLIFCDFYDNEVCFEFPLYLSPCSFNCNSGNGTPQPGPKMDNEIQNVSVHPNPATDMVTVSVIDGADSEYRVVIRDVVGKQHIVERFAREVQISTDQLGSGLYIVSVSDSEGKAVFVDKLFIAKQ